MPIDRDLLALLPQTVTVAHWTGQDQYAKPTFGAGTNWAARVEGKVSLIRNAEGQQVVSQRKAILGGVANTTVKDQVTLPDGTTPVILAVEQVPDETGPSYEVVYFE